MNIETCTRFCCLDTILDDIKFYTDEGESKQEIKARYNRPAEGKGFTVFAKHNSRVYQVDELDYSKTPSNTMINWDKRAAN
mmetsp:Transcript_39413/g.29105  ORF Transcript_39413/g.29105 Transcript_39413/m.29105 type:complete len:81 (+) Transcript_39413:512-754(+)